MTNYRKNLSIIVAVAENGVIGGNNTLLWHISEDLKRFKALTMGHPVIMGRKTFESIGRALPGRENIVVSRQPGFSAPGCDVVTSLTEAVTLTKTADEAFIIGGANIYEQALPLAGKIYYTAVGKAYEGDVRFPEPDPAQWQEVSHEHHERGEQYPDPFTFIVYERKA